jgi:hypothetical protein
MSTINDGGQAFPAGNPTHGGHEGMTLRDWFAGQALAGMISGLDAKSEGSQAIKPIAEAAYDFADAMLKAREVKP